MTPYVRRPPWTRAAALPTLVFCLSGAPAEAQVTHADYQRAMGLAERYEGLTRDVVDPAAWIGDTPRFFYRKTVEGGHVFVVGDTTGRTRPAFDHARVAAALSKATGQAYAPTRLPFATFTFVNGERAIELRAAGQSWRCELEAESCTRSTPRFGPGAPPSRGRGPVRNLDIPASTEPVRSPDGTLEALVHNDNVAIRRVGETKLRVLSTDGSEGNFYELTPQAWSPDSTRLAVYRVKPGYQRTITYVVSSPEDQVQPRLMPLFYPKPGDVVDVEQPVLFQVESGRQFDVSNTLFPNAYDMSEPVWRADGRAFTFEYNQRGHQIYRVIEVDATTGAARAVVSEETTTFFNYRVANSNYKENGTRFRHDIDDGREVIWMSERDGWKHLYLYDGATGRVKHQITKGPWVVRHVVRVDEPARRIWFMASGRHAGRDPYFHHLFRVDFDGSNLTALSSEDADHSVALSTDATHYVLTYSRIDRPPVSELRRASDDGLVAVLERGDISRLEAAGWKAPEVFNAKGRDGTTDIWGIIVRPSHFDPRKRYPVVENIYAGPQGSFVPKSFLPFLPHSAGDGIIGMQSLAELGFIVVQIDGMGTGNRSKAFHDVAWKDLKDAGLPDRILWHRAVGAKYPWYDIGRVGIYGGSAGGQNSLGALLFHPDFYRVAVSYVGCHDNRMDKIGWNEQWMSWPVGPHYAESSNVDNAWRLRGRVLLVGGELDTNVDPSSTLQVANALIKANKTFDLLWIPNGGHGAGRTSDVPEYGTRARFDYFVKHLLGQEPPDWNGAVASPTAADGQR